MGDDIRLCVVDFISAMLRLIIKVKLEGLFDKCGFKSGLYGEFVSEIEMLCSSTIINLLCLKLTYLDINILDGDSTYGDYIF